MLKSLNTGRCIWFADLPEILMAPQNQTIKLGKSFVLECDADGNPLPSITWQFNGKPLTSSTTAADLLLENENTELVVSVAKQQHAGKQSQPTAQPTSPPIQPNPPTPLCLHNSSCILYGVQVSTAARPAMRMAR